MKKQKSAQRNRQKKARRKSEQGFTLYRHPFSTMDPAVVQAGLLKMAERNTEEFPTLTETILQTFREKYPPHIIAVMAGYGLQTGVSDAGVTGKRLVSRLEQHHLELLQSLLLTLPFDDWGNLPASPEDIQKVIDAIVDLADAFHSRRFKAVEATSDVQARIVLALQERLRLHTQMVRNWGYFSEVVQISTELYAALDEPFARP